MPVIIRLGEMLEQAMELSDIVSADVARVILPAMHIDDQDDVPRGRRSLDRLHGPP